MTAHRQVLQEGRRINDKIIVKQNRKIKKLKKIKKESGKKSYLLFMLNSIFFSPLSYEI